MKKWAFPVGVVVLGVALVLHAWAAPRLVIWRFREWTRENYGVTMTYGSVAFGEMKWGPIRWQDPRVEDVARFTGFVGRELGHYPRGLVESAGMMQIVIAGELKVNGREVGGASWFGMVFIESSESSRAWECNYLGRIFHHEFFHLLDSRTGNVPSDEEWATWNPPGTEYGEGSAAPSPPSNQVIDYFTYRPEMQGFLTLYAMRAPKEDKAEVFSYMMTEPVLLRERMATDEYVNTKVVALLSSLRLLVPEMDEGYWRGIAEARAAQGGWEGC